MSERSTRSWLAAVYALTIFISAFLLFQVQPMVSKCILPWFGGSPAVWTTCMLFFQSMLFVGYAYAHFSRTWPHPKQRLLVHGAILVAAVALLHVLPDDTWKPQENGDPVTRILALLVLSVGLPYFVLSTTGPLIQAWFAESFPGRSPYRLYSLSNIGSLLALASYPIIFERVFDLPQQATYWSWGFVAFAMLYGLCAIALWRTISGQGDRELNVAPPAAPPDAPVEATPSPWHESAPANSPLSAIDAAAVPTWWHYLLWLALPAFGSAVLLATTNHVCTDVAVVPFLWVVPLALYLITFIIAFDHPRWYHRGLVATLTLIAIYIVATLHYTGMGAVSLDDCGVLGSCFHWCREAWAHWQGGSQATVPESPTFFIDFLPYLSLNFAAMFGICMLCHGELVRLRPDPKHLTAFYLLISAGGALGGVAVSLIAPHVFKTFFEWELSLYVAWFLAAGLLFWPAWTAFSYSEANSLRRESLRKLLIVIVPVTLLAVGGLPDMVTFLHYSDSGVRTRVRNFFGTLTVREPGESSSLFGRRILNHGAIVHGVQFTAADRHRQPTTYYTETSGVGRAVTHFRASPSVPSMKIGTVGLGAGTLATYVDPEDSICFYELNPAVIEIAKNNEWFTYLGDCEQRGGDCEVKLGDARLTLERELQRGEPQHYHVLVLDAFSGDAIPTHLLTEEAFQIYLKHLATAADGGEEGAFAVHITNRHVNLEPVVRGIAERFGLGHVLIHNDPQGDQAIFRSDWMVLSKNKVLLNELAQYAAPSREPAVPAVLWTDNRSNLMSLLY